MDAAIPLHCFENPFQFHSHKLNKIPDRVFKDGFTWR